LERNGLRLIHETPVRLRFRLSLLSDPLIDFSWLETWLESIRGVEAVRINRYAASVIFDYDGRDATRASILTRLRELRRRKIPSGEADPTPAAELAPLAGTLALLLTLPFLPWPARRLLTFLNISGTVFHGLDTLIHRGIKMEVLDAIAIGLSAGRGEYFTANVTHFLMQLGGYLEHRTERQSDRMLRRLLRPEPGLAWVERGGVLVQIPDDQILMEERVAVGPGERIPVDGLVLAGTALVNQANITGEPVPVRKKVMDRVIAGTVIEDGRLRIEARHVGEETTTARIARFIGDSLDRGSDTQRMADRLADQRVYLTLGTGGLIYALTRDQRRLASVFMVDYSCALKLGTPLAFRSGIYRAASEGILLKGGEAIEHLAEIDTVVFDKTGTLTHSDLEVSDVVVLDAERWSRTRLLAVTASIEEHASHPIAEAIVRKAREEKLNHIDHGEVDYLVAHGMTCPVNGDRLLIGSRHFLDEHHDVRFTGLEPAITTLQSEGKTLLYVGTQGEAIGLIALRDTLREDTPAVLAGLRNRGVRHLVMLTGDHRRRADALARQLGIDEVFSEQIPEDKARVLEQLRAEGRRVAFVGDGVNDGPALAAADVGIAMSRGTELARATADVVLLEDRLGLLLNAIDVSKRTMAMVSTNYRAAIGINTGVMIGAALGWLSPVSTAVLHNGTTVGLLVRALRGLDSREHSESRSVISPGEPTSRS
jgi:cation-transporting P-type ATPase C